MSKLTLKQLDAGIDAVLANANSLIEESKLLLQYGFHARAYTLAHIAREELAKVTMFYASGLRILAGNAVNWSKLHKRLRDHKSKLTSDGLLAVVSTPGAAETLPIEKVLGGSHIRNEWKNDSLYVALKGDEFKTPSEIITHRKAERTVALASFALADTMEYLSAGGKLSKRDPETAMKLFAGVFNPDKLQVGDAPKILKVLSQCLTQARAAATARKGTRQRETSADANGA
jgi:AbiV family abortive infection protein